MKGEIFHIIGGGVAGLASAIAVANSGNSAILMEKAARFEAVGAGLQLGPNAVRALQKLDAWDAVEPITSSPPEIHIRNGKNGRLLTRIELGHKFEKRFGMPYRVAHRADLITALYKVAKSKPQIQILTNTEALNYGNYTNVIAADGVWSNTRQALFPGTEAVVTHEIFLRTLFKTVIANENVNLWLYPGGHVVHYPVGKPAKLNVIAITQGQDVKAHFEGACDELQFILNAAPEWQIWKAAYVPKLEKWNKDAVTLIGDAAHGTLPYLAQGAAMALEDAAYLKNLLQIEPDRTTAFQKLSLARHPRTTRVHTTSVRTGRIYHLDGVMAEARNIALRFMPPQFALFMSDWLWQY